MIPRNFLSDTCELQGSDAVAALIVSETGRYLLQLRDDIPGIFYPGHWGCFGGAVSDGESPRASLVRELTEELEFAPEHCEEFIRFDFDLSKVGGQGKLYRLYYVVPVTENRVADFRLHEGAAMDLLTPEEIFAKPNVTPYDSFALWLHMARGRFA